MNKIHLAVLAQFGERPMGNTDGALELEERLAHQDKLIDDLSTQLARQWDIIAKLEARLGSLSSRFGSLEESYGEAPANVKPPHY